MPKLYGIREGTHFEHCFVFKTPDPLNTAVPATFTSRLYAPCDATFILVGVHTGCVLPPTADEFRLKVGARCKAVVTFNTMSAFFPRRQDGNVQSYTLARPVYVPRKGELVAELCLVQLRNLPDEIAITVGGVLTREIM